MIFIFNDILIILANYVNDFEENQIMIFLEFINQVTSGVTFNLFLQYYSIKTIL
jgi:hypothetical protein